MDVDDVGGYSDEYSDLEYDAAVAVTAAAEEKKKRRRPLINGSYNEKRRKLLELPEIGTEEFMRLMKRVPKDGPKSYNYRCGVCLTKHPNHYANTCPCLDKIPEDITEIGPDYDIVCLGCGKIGDPPCCGQGTYAAIKYCGACRGHGHWYWEMRCPKDHVYSPSTIRLPGVEYEDVPITKEVNGTLREVPGYFKIKKVKSGSSSQSSKNWKRFGNKIVSRVKKIAL